MKNNTLRQTLATFVAIVTVFLAQFARGQSSPAPAGGGTQSVVVPGLKLPLSIPWGSTNAILTWSVTNTQWDVVYDYENPGDTERLNTETAFELVYSKGKLSRTSTRLTVKSWTEFEDLIRTNGMVLLKSLKKRNDFNPNESVTLLVSRSFANRTRNRGYPAFEMEKDLGRVSEITEDSFRDVPVTFFQLVVRVPGLSRLDVEVKYPPYRYSWPYGGAKPASTYPQETTSEDVIILNEWYSRGLFEARVTIMVDGETAEYTQSVGDNRVAPSELKMNRDSLELFKTAGTRTSLEYSIDLVTWIEFYTIPWSHNSGYVKIPVFNPHFSHVYFRARTDKFKPY